MMGFRGGSLRPRSLQAVPSGGHGVPLPLIGDVDFDHLGKVLMFLRVNVFLFD